MKADRSEITYRGEIETVIDWGEIPVLNPRNPVAFVKPGFAKCTTACLLLELKFSASYIRDREVRKLQIIDDEARCVRSPLGRRLNSVPKKRQLVTEALSFSIKKVAGEIPPFGFKFAMSVMVPRKFIAPAGLRDFPIGSKCDNRQRKSREFENRKSEIG